MINGNLIKYTVSFNPNGGHLESFESSIEVSREHPISNLPVPEKEGKKFLGWYTGWTSNDIQITSNTPILSDLNLIAMWDTYDVDFLNYDGSVFNSAVVNQGNFVSAPETEPTRPTDEYHSYIFNGWDFDFESPINSDISINSLWTNTNPVYTFDFGSYPQSVVEDASVKEMLNTQNNSVVDGEIIECDTDNDGDKEKYLAKEVESPMRSDTGAKIDIGINYFKFEPIKWKVITETSSSYFAISDRVLDVQKFNTSSYIIEDPFNFQQTSISDDYSKSTIREWLNSTFLNSAFSIEEQSRLISTELENNRIGVENDFVYDTALDKVYLPSYEDLTGYPFDSNESRLGNASDYAKIISDDKRFLSVEKETYGNCEWYLRTHKEDYTGFVYFVDDYGGISDWGTSDPRGIRPMIQISK